MNYQANIPPPPMDLTFLMKTPLSDIIMIRTAYPAYGHESITITVKENISFAPYYFMDGGVKSLINIIQRLVSIKQSEYDPDIYTFFSVQPPNTLNNQVTSSPVVSKQDTPEQKVNFS